MTEWREELRERSRKEKLETYLFAMKEDLSEWIAGLMNISVTAETFMNVLDNGIHLCRLANMIQKAAERYLKDNPEEKLTLPTFAVTYKQRGASYGSFVSRDNVANFIRWCRELGISDVIIFESEDLVLHRYQKPVILTLLDVARRAAKFDVEPPDLVKMEEEIDEEIAMEQEALKEQALSLSEVQQDVPRPASRKPKRTNTKPKTKNFIPKNLDALVKETVEQCTCADNPFPVEKIADGKYKIGENRVLIFVRVMRNHVMVRVGGGWDTLENYIQKHDPCRAGGRSSGISGGRHRSRCQTPSHNTNHNNEHDSSLHSASNTSVASSDSSSSSSSVSRLSPSSSQNNSLQSMVCVFGESGPRAEIVSPGDGQPLNTRAKRSEAAGKADKIKTTPGGKSLGSRPRSLIDLTNDKEKENCYSQTLPKRRTTTTPGKKLNPNTTSPVALRATLQQADLTFKRSKTSDAILRRARRRNTDSPNSVVQRRGNGNLSREASSDNLRAGRAKTTGARRKSMDERRKRSPDVRRRSVVSPVPARRRLNLEYEASAQKPSALRKDLNENNLTFTRSFSADAIKRGRGSSSMACSPARSSTASSDLAQPPSRIPVPLTTYGKPRGVKRTSAVSEGPSGTSSEGNCHTHNQNGDKWGHCDGACCTCDEGFIDDEGSRLINRPSTLFNGERQQDFEKTALTSRLNHEGVHSDICHDCNHSNSKKTSMAADCREPIYGSNIETDIFRHENGDVSLEWKEVMTDILKYEESRISDKIL